MIILQFQMQLQGSLPDNLACHSLRSSLYTGVDPVEYEHQTLGENILSQPPDYRYVRVSSKDLSRKYFFLILPALQAT
jgi:hypothetical protein